MLCFTGIRMPGCNQESGYEVEESRTLAFPGYKRKLGRQELTSFVALDWEASESAIDDDPAIRIHNFFDELRGNASIDWRDATFRLMYEVALEEERKWLAYLMRPEAPTTTPPIGKEIQPRVPTVEECQEFLESLKAVTGTGPRSVDLLVQVEGPAADRAKRMLQVCGDVLKEAENAR